MPKTLEINDNNDIYIIKIGNNAEDNWKVIDDSDELDIWFHLDEYPSAHIVLKTNKKELNTINKQILFKCASECRNRTNIKDIKKDKKIKVIYTEIKNIKKGNDIGSVYSKNTKSIFVC
jgi:predicted ribosome quality control (RQC) complex YloA/Tae2 family protein